MNYMPFMWEMTLLGMECMEHIEYVHFKAWELSIDNNFCGKTI